MHDAFSALEVLHNMVTEGAGLCAQELEVAHGHKAACGLGCTRCCLDDLTVFEIEAEAIRRSHAELLSEGEPGPAGACAFLNAAGGCRIYEQRPYVCRTQGLPLRWLEPDGEGGGIEYRDICPLNENPDGQPLVEISADVFWTIGEWESKLRMLQEMQDGGEGRRVALRALFQADSD